MWKINGFLIQQDNLTMRVCVCHSDTDVLPMVRPEVILYLAIFSLLSLSHTHTST